MKLNFLNFAKTFLAVLVVSALLAGNGGVEARRKNKKAPGSKLNRTKANKRHRRRHSVRDDDVTAEEETRQLAELMSSLKESRQSRRIAKPSHKVSEWTDAVIGVGSEFADRNLKIDHVAAGKFGFHIEPRSVFGKVVHVRDADPRHHYGCSDVISNRGEIPRDEPWVALVRRGKCYFFNKISLGEAHNASAVIVYDDKEGDIQVMNTAGTGVVSLMINLEDGSKIADLVASGADVYANITVGEYHSTQKQTPPPSGGKFQHFSSVQDGVTDDVTGGSGRHFISTISFVLVLFSFIFVHNS